MTLFLLVDYNRKLFKYKIIKIYNWDYNLSVYFLSLVSLILLYIIFYRWCRTALSICAGYKKNLLPCNMFKPPLCKKYIWHPPTFLFTVFHVFKGHYTCGIRVLKCFGWIHLQMAIMRVNKHDFQMICALMTDTEGVSRLERNIVFWQTVLWAMIFNQKQTKSSACWYLRVGVHWFVWWPVVHSLSLPPSFPLSLPFPLSFSLPLSHSVRERVLLNIQWLLVRASEASVLYRRLI